MSKRTSKIRNMTLVEFKKGAGLFYPLLDKELIINKRAAYRYSGTTKKITIIKKRR